MELRQLRYFLSAANHLSFTKAAEECCIVQSAMSQQIRALENELDVTLFERTKKGLRLTPEGRVTAEQVRKLLDHVEEVQTAVQQAKISAMSTLRLGCQGNLFREILPRALAALRSEGPNRIFHVRNDIFHHLLGALRDGQIDCIIALYEEAMALEAWMSTRIICNDRLVAMLPKNSPLAACDIVPLDALLSETLILFASNLRYSWLGDIQERVTGERCVFAVSQTAIETLVAAGCGVSLCAGSAVRPHSSIVYRPVSGLPPLQVCLMWRRDSAEEPRILALASQLVMTSSETISLF